MSTRSMKSKQSLTRFGELVWFGLTLESNLVHGYLQVPSMEWRYASPREEVAQLIENVVKMSPTQVEWTLDRTRRNWVLLPTRIWQETQGLNNPAFADAVHSVNVEDQQFCSRALSDFELIIQRLQQYPIPEG
ncbi:hypothetical protein SALBM311S_03422 [Streptomyces alboniger]